MAFLRAPRSSQLTFENMPRSPDIFSRHVAQVAIAPYHHPTQLFQRHHGPSYS
jgi:hypothetical protein